MRHFRRDVSKSASRAACGLPLERIEWSSFHLNVDCANCKRTAWWMESYRLWEESGWNDVADEDEQQRQDDEEEEERTHHWRQQTVARAGYVDDSWNRWPAAPASPLDIITDTINPFAARRPADRYRGMLESDAIFAFLQLPQREQDALKILILPEELTQ